MGFVSGAPSGASLALGPPLRVGLSAASPPGSKPVRAFRFYPWSSCPPGANAPPPAQLRWTIALEARRSPELRHRAPTLRLPAPPATVPTERPTIQQHEGHAHGGQDVRSCSAAPWSGMREWGKRVAGSFRARRQVGARPPGTLRRVSTRPCSSALHSLPRPVSPHPRVTPASASLWSGCALMLPGQPTARGRRLALSQCHTATGDGCPCRSPSPVALPSRTRTATVDPARFARGSTLAPFPAAPAARPRPGRTTLAPLGRPPWPGPRTLKPPHVPRSHRRPLQAAGCAPPLPRLHAAHSTGRRFVALGPRPRADLPSPPRTRFALRTRSGTGHRPRTSHRSPCPPLPSPPYRPSGPRRHRARDRPRSHESPQPNGLTVGPLLPLPTLPCPGYRRE